MIFDQLIKKILKLSLQILICTFLISNFILFKSIKAQNQVSPTKPYITLAAGDIKNTILTSKTLTKDNKEESKDIKSLKNEILIFSAILGFISLSSLAIFCYYISLTIKNKRSLA